MKNDVVAKEAVKKQVFLLPEKLERLKISHSQELLVRTVEVDGLKVQLIGMNKKLDDAEYERDGDKGRLQHLQRGQQC